MTLRLTNQEESRSLVLSKIEKVFDFLQISLNYSAKIYESFIVDSDLNAIFKDYLLFFVQKVNKREHSVNKVPQKVCELSDFCLMAVEKLDETLCARILNSFVKPSVPFYF